jgi:hypothetical protein
MRIPKPAAIDSLSLSEQLNASPTEIPTVTFTKMLFKHI